MHALIDLAFGPHNVEIFLARLSHTVRNVRNFEAVLERGLLGKDAVMLYNALPVSDQAQTRERYFQAVEKVPEDLRQRYCRVYTAY